MDTRAQAAGTGIQCQAQAQVGADATGHHQALRAALLECRQGLGRQHVDDGLLGGRRHVGPRGLVDGRRQLAHLGHDRRLQAGEREVEIAAVQQGPGQRIGFRVAVVGQPGQGRPAGVAQAQQLGTLVEGLAGRVVDGLAQQRVLAHVGHVHELRMATRHQQRDEGKRRRVVGQERRQQVAFEVVDAQHGPPQRRAQRHCHTGTHQQRAGQPRPAGVGHEVDLVQAARGLGQHLAGQRQHALHMVARGQFGHHAAERGMHVHLRVQGLRPQLRQAVGASLDQRHAGFVTR